MPWRFAGEPVTQRDRGCKAAGVSPDGDPTLQPAGRADDARQHARERRAVAFGLLPQVSPRDHHRSRPMAGPYGGVLIRASHSVHEVRDHRRRRAAELAGESEAMKRPSAKQPSPPASKPNRWNIYHIKGTPAILLGHVEASDEESAIKRAIEEFKISPALQKRL